MVTEKLFSWGLIIFALAAGGIFCWVRKLDSASLSRWEKLPRNLWLGTIVAAISLAWCIPHAQPILPSSMHKYLIPAVLICTWLSFQFLDYLFARACGGFFILLTHFVLAESFTYRTPMLPFISTLCLILGITGLFFCGKPYLMRDLIRKIAVDYRWKKAALFTCGVYTFCFLLFGLHFNRVFR